MTVLHVAACTNDVHVLDYAIKKKTTGSIDIPSDGVSLTGYNHLCRAIHPLNKQLHVDTLTP